MGAAEKRCKCTSDNAPIAQGKAAPEGERLHLVSQLEQTKLAKTVKWLLFSSVLILLPWRFKQLLGPSMESRKTFSLSHLTFNQSCGCRYLLVSTESDAFTVNPLYFQPIPLGFIRPQGWLENQLNLMSVGLAGHELDFYRVVRDSPWLGGGTEYSGLNEGLPYWFNGLVPLAYGLDDPRLKEQTTNVLDYILDHQQADGWLGPEPYNRRDIWGRFPLCLGLMQLVGADPGQASRIVPAMHRFVSIMHQMLTYNDGFKEFWGRVRYPDMIIVLQWLYEYYPQGNEVMLLEAMLLLDQQGLHWKYYYDQDNFIFADLDTIRPPIHSGSFVFPYVHAVNAGQGMFAAQAPYQTLLIFPGLKSGAVLQYVDCPHQLAFD
ncbi:MAG: hypothetical protein LQ342_006874 [Letrouitia transgressa]|nr:MAG: hypothetical protein LQ342_006874 [Letrouitia transgressa]